MLGRPKVVREAKAIHDPVLGTSMFTPPEVSLLDTPLLQRLRYIAQTGCVYLVFPGARSRGHVFAPREVVPDAFVALQSLLGDKYDLRLKESTVKGLCHW